MRSKAPLLLMEQMVMLLVFALAAALCVQAFVKSDAISARGEARDQAVVIAQTAAETIRLAGGTAEEALEAAAQQLPEAVYENGTLRVAYDAQWTPAAGAEEGRFLEVRALPEASGLSEVFVTVHSDGEELFAMEAAWQRPLS